MSPTTNDICILTIDQGNSSAKAVVWNGEDPVDSIRMAQPAIEELLPLLEKYDIRGCAFCSVAHNDAKFLETLRRLVEGRLVVLTPTLPLPIEISYASRRTLGSDRVAAAIGAVALFPDESLLVVDAGTAVTLDFVSAKGGFMGGNIAPGMALRFESLRQSTSRLPLVEPEGPLPEFGEDTLTAIRCGVVRGMISEIADAYSLSAEKFGCHRVVMAGADAPILAPLLEEREIRVSVDPYLVGRGLQKIYTEDISQD